MTERAARANGTAQRARAIGDTKNRVGWLESVERAVSSAEAFRESFKLNLQATAAGYDRLALGREIIFATALS